MTDLKKLVLETIADNPTGINHVQIVKTVLARGYVHPDGNLSHDIMQIVKKLVHRGSLEKSEETRLVTPGVGFKTAKREAS